MLALARVNGYAQLRQLVELAANDAQELSRALPDLLKRGLVELLDPPGSFLQSRELPALSSGWRLAALTISNFELA